MQEGREGGGKTEFLKKIIALPFKAKNYFLGACDGVATNPLKKKEDKQDDFQACGSFQTSNFIGSFHQK